MTILIVGCGYVGLPLGSELARAGHIVYGFRRSGEALLKNEGIIPFLGDICEPATLARLPDAFECIINTVSSSRGGPEEYQRVYLEGTRNIIERFQGHPPKLYIYTSSTSVYAQTDGSIVTEESPATPKSATSQILRETEQLLLNRFRDSKFPAVILRVSGIYGPQRGHLFLKYLRDEAFITGRGDRLLNMIHLEDLVQILIRSISGSQPGQIYNATDDQPVSELEFYQWLSTTLRKPLPLSTEVDPGSRKRGLTSKRISNAKLKNAFHYTFKYPTFREGYTAEIERLRQLNLLPASA